MDQAQPIYDTRLSYNSSQVLGDLINRLEGKLGEGDEPFVREDLLQNFNYRVSPYFLVSVESFCRSGGFDLLKLALKGPRGAQTLADRKSYTPSFPMFNQVLTLVYGLRDILRPTFYSKLAFELRDICLEYARNYIDEDSLRFISKKDLTVFT